LGQKLSNAVSSEPSLFAKESIGLIRDRQLFGEDEDSTVELDDAEKQGENGELPLLSRTIVTLLSTLSRYLHFSQLKK
jgi:hypothetical protein